MAEQSPGGDGRRGAVVLPRGRLPARVAVPPPAARHPAPEGAAPARDEAQEGDCAAAGAARGLDAAAGARRAPAAGLRHLLGARPLRPRDAHGPRRPRGGHP